MGKITSYDEIQISDLEGSVSEIIAKLEKLRDARGDVYVSYSMDCELYETLSYQYEREESEPDNFSFEETHRDGKLFDLEKMVQDAAKRKARDRR